MLSYFSIILILSVWACSSQAAPTYRAPPLPLVSEDNLKIMEQVAAQTSKLLLDSLFRKSLGLYCVRCYVMFICFLQRAKKVLLKLENKSIATIIEVSFDDKESSTYSPKGRLRLPNFVTGLPRKTEKAEKQQNSEFTVPKFNIDDIISEYSYNKLSPIQTTQLIQEML